MNQTILDLGSGGVRVVSMRAFYSDDPSLNPAEAYYFTVELTNINKIKQGWPIEKIMFD